MRKSRGFTLIELMVAMIILVVIFGLVTFLYTKASKIRKVVVVTSEIQQTLSQIMDTLTYGDRADESHFGIIHSTGLDDNTNLDTMHNVTFSKGTDTMEITIEPEGNITVYWSASATTDPIILNLGKKVKIDNESKFEYFNTNGERVVDLATERDKVSFIRITLWARSTDPGMKSAPSVPLVTGVRLRGI